MVSVVIHTNPALANQRETAAWLKQGFSRHGITADITASRTQEADVQVVQGPWYCFDYWRERADTHRVLWLNRCFYGHHRFDLSLGWLQPDGSRDFRNHGAMDGHGRLPTLKAIKDARRCAVIFADYGQRDIAERVAELRQTWNGSLYFRPHPQQQDVSVKAITLKCPLEQVWSLADVAIGHSSTVLVEARINGLQIDCSDPLNVVNEHPEDRETWLRELSWAQWSAHDDNPELQRGDFWSHLHDC